MFCTELIRQVAFRDYLRKHPDVAASYGELKYELARQFMHDREGYSLAKTAFVNSVLDRTGLQYQADHIPTEGIMMDEET
jgi:GrpB-like predicted nucleotidyltransferase (UPF0157 family)